MHTVHAPVSARDPTAARGHAVADDSHGNDASDTA